MRGEIWLADLIVAVAAEARGGRRPDRDTVRDVARLLGLYPLADEPSPPGAWSRPDPARPAPAEPPSLSAVDGEHAAEEEPPMLGHLEEPAGPPPEPEPAPGVERKAGLRRTWEEPPRLPWREPGITALERPEINDSRLQPRHVPLLPPKSTTAIIQAALTRPAPGSDIDVAAVVESLARLRQVSMLPRLPVPTLRFGVQVLVDRAAPMFPFYRDQQALIDNVRDVVGRGTTQVRYFAHSPLRGAGPGHRRSWTEYRPPAPGCPVLVLSGFNIHSDAERYRADWQGLVHLLSKQDSAAVAFVPFPRGRWPAWLSGLLPLVCWDRSANTAAVRTARESAG